MSVNFFKNPLTELTEEEELFRQSVRDFASKNISPIWEALDQASSERPVVHKDLISKLGQQGLLALMCRPEHGGQGATETMAAIAVEELAYADPTVATAVYTLLNIGWPFILEMYGKEEVSGPIIERVSRGEAFFGIASTESQGGSDIANLRTKAYHDEDSFSVSGTKSFISGVNEVFNLDWGGGWLLLARTGEEGYRGISAFAAIVRENGKEKEGLTHSLFHGAGRHGLSTGSITFEKFLLPKDNLVGEEGNGFYIAMEGFNCARILVAAACIGASRWLLEKAAEWIKDRKVGGKRLSSYQSVSFKFAELTGKYEAARMMVYRAARLFDRVYMAKDVTHTKRDLNGPVALAKMWGPQVGLEIAQETMKWYGAASFVSSHPVQRSMLGLLSYVVGAEGAQNVMQYIVARELLGSDYIR